MMMLMVALINTTVKMMPLMVTLVKTVLVLAMPEANDAGTDNVEAADTDIDDADYNATDDAEAENYEAIPNERDGVINDIGDNDEVTDTNNYDIDDPANTDTQHDPICCLVWYRVDLINRAQCASIN